VRDLRDFSRQEAVGDAQEAADFNSGIMSTVNIVRGRARAANVEIQTELSPLPEIACYPAKLNQVVLNLIVNAIDACVARGVHGKVILTTRRVGDSVELQVSDNGCGISADIRDKIFDPFFTTKPPGQGTGLGLSICHGIVADHGGSLSVETEVGKGTTFVMKLPVNPGVPENLKTQIANLKE
jgi:signal transduction histidine kinase